MNSISNQYDNSSNIPDNISSKSDYMKPECKPEKTTIPVSLEIAPYFHIVVDKPKICLDNNAMCIPKRPEYTERMQCGDKYQVCVPYYAICQPMKMPEQKCGCYMQMKPEYDNQSMCSYKSKSSRRSCKSRKCCCSRRRR